MRLGFASPVALGVLFSLDWALIGNLGSVVLFLHTGCEKALGVYIVNGMGDLTDTPKDSGFSSSLMSALFFP